MGAMQVAVVDCRISESTDRGGFCTFSITFVEAGENTYPGAAENTASAVDASADLAIEFEWVEFEEEFSIDAVASFVSEAAATIANGWLDTLMSYARRYRAGSRRSVLVRIHRARHEIDDHDAAERPSVVRIVLDRAGAQFAR